MKYNFKSYTFWISIAGAVILIIQNVGSVFGFAIDEEVFMNIVNSVCGFLVVLGIINNPKKAADETDEETDEEIISETEQDSEVKTEQAVSTKDKSLNKKNY